MNAARTPIEARLRRLTRSANCARRSAKLATTTIARLRVNRISGTGIDTTSHLMMASCKLNAAQAAAAKATPVNVREASVLAADTRSLMGSKRSKAAGDVT